MSKQSTSQKYIFKIHSSRLRKSKWNLNLTIQEAIGNEEMVFLADSTTLRFIREIENNTYTEEQVKEIRKSIKKLKSEPTNTENRKKTSQLYTKLYDLLFVRSYINVIIDNNQDYDRMNSKNGFYINGIKFRRLLATTGGAKNSTVIFVNVDIYEELHNRIENGRNINKPMVPAKLEAYKSLTCSASIPVSHPNGVLVVKDCETIFKSNVIKIDDSKGIYPEVTQEQNYEITLNESDGYGLILPDLSLVWGRELGENYVSSGFCLRNSYCKGMLFTFDFIDFANKVAKNNIVIDAWGNSVDVTKVQIVLTTSMLKLWDSYDSIDHYLECCDKNGYTFSVTKVIPEKLENERNMNYQFIQSLNLTADGISKLIEPTVSEIKDVISEDWRKSILFLKGVHLHENSFNQSDNDFIKALMIEKEMIRDPFVRSKIHNMIKKRINEAKVGVLKVRGNFSIVSGDPYSLCQSMFGLEVTGLLKAGEFYSKYWNEKTVTKVACFRAPMTCHNNIRILRLRNTDEMNYWYKYIRTCTIFNSWDTTSHALNGLDHDGDSVLTTDNDIILNSIDELDAIACVQKTAAKKIVEESDLIQSNKNSFGDEIGATTNRITSMFDVMANFEKSSPEYRELSYRIQCGQNYQQNAIDKTKGIVSKSMPKEWYTYQENKPSKDDTEEVRELKEFNLRIMADKKPYFFTYIYPYLMREYKKFTDNSTKNCYKRFGVTIQELIGKSNKTEEESIFLKYYFAKIPVSISNSVMNQICRLIETDFINHKNKFKSSVEFDYKLLMSDKRYSKGRYSAIRKLYEDHNKKLQEHSQTVKKERIEKNERKIMRNIFIENFKKAAIEICNNEEELTNIVIDICYKNNNKSKQFAWDICGEQIIKNLLMKSDYKVQYPISNEHGEIEFGGDNFRLLMIEMEDEN